MPVCLIEADRRAEADWVPSVRQTWSSGQTSWQACASCRSRRRCAGSCHQHSWPRVPSWRACVLNPESEIGKCCRGCRHAPAAFGDDTALGWGDRSGRGAVESGKQEGSADGSLVGLCAGPAGCTCVGRCCSIHHAHRVDCLRRLRAGTACSGRDESGAQGCTESRTGSKAPGAPCCCAASPGRSGSPGGQGGEQPQLIFSPWTKFCLKGQEANAKQVCFTGKDGRVESGMPVVAAVLIEPENDPKKVLRVTLPLGMSIQPGTRVIVDSGQPMTGPYVICFNNGCMADYEASGELIGKLKKGQGLVIQGINGAGQPISLVVPLGDFAKAYDGPPTDPKKFEEQQKQLQDELQKRAEEARKKLESQQQAAPAAPAAPPAAPTR